jgi:hypothetical protein
LAAAITIVRQRRSAACEGERIEIRLATGAKSMTKKVWRKPEVKQIAAGSAESNNVTNANDGTRTQGS